MKRKKTGDGKITGKYFKKAQEQLRKSGKIVNPFQALKPERFKKLMRSNFKNATIKE